MFSSDLKRSVWSLAFLSLACCTNTALAVSVSGNTVNHPVVINCATDRCGLKADGPYPNIVIGVLTHVGTNAELTKVFHWAKSHGYWQDLPVSIKSYLDDVTMLTIAPSLKPDTPSITVFIQKTEYEAAPSRVGDFVRYISHRNDKDKPKNDPVSLQFFYGLTGCVVTLCTQGYPACIGRYQTGVFNPDGQQVSVSTNKPLRNGIRINPVSLLRVRSKHLHNKNRSVQ